MLSDRLPPQISVIIPVLGEERIINRTVAHVESAMAGSGAEIIVVDGDPEGGTISCVSSSDARLLTGPRGRGPQMNAGASTARGGILLFLHADTRLPSNAPERIISVCSDHDIAGGSFSLGIDNPRRIYRLIEMAVSLRTRLTRIPYGDQAIFIKKSVFKDMGGFSDFPIMEDIDMMRRLKAGGRHIRILSDKVRTSGRRWETEGPLFCTLRNTLLASLFYAGVAPGKLKRFYR